MKIKDILAIRRKDLGLTQAEIAKACSVSEATVSRWEKGQIADIKQSKILSLSEILQISPALIIGHTETDAYGPLTRSFMEVPLYDAVSCGNGLFAEDTIRDYIPVPVQGLSVNAEHFCLFARGDSMTGAGIEPKDLLVFEKNSGIQNGQIGCFVLQDGEIVCKKFTRQNGIVLLQSANPDYDPILIGDGDSAFTCAGILRKIIRNI